MSNEADRTAVSGQLSRRRWIAAGVVGLALLSGFVSAASARPDFRTPGEAAYCDFWPGYQATGGVHGGFINADGEDDGVKAAVGCWTPNDGFEVTMSNRGRVVKVWYRDELRGYDPIAKQILRFGQQTTFRGIRCVSRAKGLTCRNRSGHGWWLGRFKGYRIF